MEVVYSSKTLNTHLPNYKDQDHNQAINEYSVSLLSQKYNDTNTELFISPGNILKIRNK
jgi:hypothetical protein